MSAQSGDEWVSVEGFSMLWRLTCALAMELDIDPERLVEAFTSEAAMDYCRQLKDIVAAWPKIRPNGESGED